jgi:hypothetical protein
MNSLAITIVSKDNKIMTPVYEVHSVDKMHEIIKETYRLCNEQGSVVTKIESA